MALISQFADILLGFLSDLSYPAPEKSALASHWTQNQARCADFGGEEFLIIMTHATRENVEKVAERIRAELAIAPFTFSGCDMITTAALESRGARR
jgi:GGDEF domain-containing protein